MHKTQEIKRRISDKEKKYVAGILDRAREMDPDDAAKFLYDEMCLHQLQGEIPTQAIQVDIEQRKLVHKNDLSYIFRPKYKSIVMAYIGSFHRAYSPTQIIKFIYVCIGRGMLGITTLESINKSQLCRLCAASFEGRQFNPSAFTQAIRRLLKKNDAFHDHNRLEDISNWVDETLNNLQKYGS